MKREEWKKVTAFLLAGIVGAAALTGCGDGNQNQAGASSDPGSGGTAAKEEKAVRLNIVTNAGVTSSQDDPNFPFEIFGEIEKQTGVELTYTNYNDEALKVMLAGGDIGDIVCVSQDYIQPFIEGGHIIPLDDYIASGDTNITRYHPQRVDFSKKFFSNGTGKVYFLPASAEAGGHSMDIWNGYYVRWDYYKELGYPEITDDDSYLNVLSDMQEAHPKTEDGKKTYGLAFFNDWTGLWGWWYAKAFTKGYYNWGPGGYLYSVDGAQIVNNYFDPDSPLWMSLEYGFKANQMGLLDPDSFTMKQADVLAKSKEGQYLGSPINWWVSSYYAQEKLKDADTLKGYAAVPVEGTYFVANNGTDIGQTNKLMAITSNCKNPDKAMEVLNYLFGAEGGRLLFSGIEGVHWETVDGVPKLKQETIDAKNAGGDPWSKTGIGGGGLSNFFGLGGSDRSDIDQAPMSLWETEDIYEQQMTALTRDICEYYGADYPYQIYENMVKEGKMKDFSNLEQDIPNAMPIAEDDIKRIDAKLDDIMTKAIPRVVLAETKEEFEIQKEAVLAELKAAGAEESQNWWFTAWEEARAYILSLDH